eukprot:303120-Pyramimonas_sp.AAC.1
MGVAVAIYQSAAISSRDGLLVVKAFGQPNCNKTAVSQFSATETLQRQAHVRTNLPPKDS